MSEYNNFLKHFNKQKLGDQTDDAVREDIIPVNPTLKEAEEKAEAIEAQQTMLPEKDEKIVFPDASETSDTVTSARFIKTNSTPFISVRGDSRSEIPTTVEKYTDRLTVKTPEKKLRTGYTGKINTYAANHSPAADTPKFIPAGEDEKTAARKNTVPGQTPENTAVSQTKIIPTVIKTEDEEIGEPKVILEKLPESDANEKTRIINNKGTLLRQIAKTSGTMTEEDEQQLTMEGFMENEAEEQQRIIDEEELLEKELSEVREKRINNFRFWSKSKAPTGESEDKSFNAPREEKKLPSFISDIEKRFRHLNTDFVPVGNEEYSDPAKRKEVFSRLIGIRKSLILKTFAIALLGIILVLINISTSLSAAMNNGFFSVFGGNALVYNTVNLVFLLITGVLMADDLKKGLFSILKIRPKTDSALLFVYTGAVLQNIMAYFTMLKPESDYHMLSGAAILLAVPVLISKIFYCDSTRHCFKAVAATSDKSYLRKISDENIIAALLKDRSGTESNVVYAGKTRFISNFLKKCATGAFSAQASSKIVAASMGVSLIAGLIGLIATGSPVYSLGCLTMCAALSFPISSLVFTGYMLSGENSTLSVKSSFISNFSDAHNFCNIDDIVLDGSDMFTAEVTNIACAKNVNQKQAEFCAAVITSKTDGILRKAFSVMGDGMEDHFPEVEGLVFEDKMGVSAWISDCKVLLGTKDYLTNHNVELPPDNTVPFIIGENEKPLFLSIEGHFAAVFSVKYSCNAIAARNLSQLTKKGANILLSISEPNITEDFAEKLLGLPANSLRIVTSSANEKFSEQKNTVTDSEDTGIVFADSFDALCRTMASAVKLDKIRRVSKTIGEAGAVAGLIFGFLLVIVGATAGINSWLIMILQILWILLGFVITPLVINIPLKAKIALPDNLGEKIKNIASNEKSPVTGRFDNKASSEDEESEAEEYTSEDEAEEPQKNEEKEEQAKTENNDGQLIMEGAPYTRPPEVIDFSLITGNEDISDEEPSKQTVSDELLDSYAASADRRNRATETSEKPASVKRKGILSSISVDDDDDDDDIPELPVRKSPSINLLKKKTAKTVKNKNSAPVKEQTAKRTILSFLDEKMPEPPRFDLGKKTEEKEDPLNAKFVPPETDHASAVYNDSFFSSFDTKEDDKAFSEIRRQRESEESEGEFDFWTKR
ncbi:MAG: hypothetical protein IJA39_06235 [Clostridia bacterium]|nr:hypothetical protein [Clostridia bacterium]